MRRIKFTALFLLELMILSSCSEASTQKCELTRRQPRPNANNPSDFPFDIITDPMHAKLLNTDLIPLACATKSRFETTGCKTKLHKTSLFQSRESLLLKNRNTVFYPTIEKIREDVRKEMQHAWQYLTKEYTSDKFNADLKKVANYRTAIEHALFAHQQTHLNCGEHASAAFLDELLLAQNECAPQQPTKIHQIILTSSKTPPTHAFIVSGSTTLSEIKVTQNAKALASLFANMDGTIIDPWNDPTHGGVRMPANEARKKFDMYGAKAATIWDCVEIQEFSTENMHAYLNRQNIPKKLRAILLKLAGPTLDEVRQRISKFDILTAKP